MYLGSTLLINLGPKLCLLNDLALCLELILAVVTYPRLVAGGLTTPHLSPTNRQLPTLSTPLLSSLPCLLFVIKAPIKVV